MSIRHDSVRVRVPSYIFLLTVTMGGLVPSMTANTLPSLGTAGDYAVLGFDGAAAVGKQISNSSVIVNGNEGVVSNGTIVNTSSVINGNVYVFNSSEYSNSFGILTGTEFANNLADSNAQTADLSLAGTTETNVLNLLNTIITEPSTDVTINSNVTTATQINGVGEKGNQCGTDNVCVVKINGNINLNGANSLTLNGTSSDSFIIEVTGNMTLSGAASLNLTGGVTANNVIYDFTGTSPISTQAGDMVNGILIAKSESMTLGGIITGDVIGGDGISLTAGTIVNDPPSATPEPKLTVLLGAMLATLAFRRSRRNKPARS